MSPRLGRAAGAALFIVCAAAFITWPQPLYLHSRIVAHHDAYFSIWRLAWIAHALATSPRHLFDANIFYPAPNTLAYSDATLLQGLIAAPVLWIGTSRVLVYNLLLLAGFVGSGLGVFVLVRHLTQAAAPALVAAAIFTMAPYRIEHVMHLELQWAMFVPLTFWALHRTVETGSWKHAVLAGLFAALQVLSCVYYGVFLILTLLVFVPALLVTGPIDRARASILPLAFAAAVALLLIVPYALPYRAAAADVGTRDLSEISRYSATSLSYLSASNLNWIWGWTADRWGSAELRLYPGIVALALAMVGVTVRPRRLVIVYVVVAALAIEMSFGTNGPLYRSVVARIDALAGFRSWSRFAIVAQCAIAVLAGYGAQRLFALVGPRATTAMPIACSAILALLLVDYANRPVPLVDAVPIAPPDVYRVLEHAPPGVILELPAPRPDALPGQEPFYQAWSVWHWRPLVNGYSGYYPGFYLETLQRLRYFPDDESIARLQRLDVRYVVVHQSFYEPARYTELMLAMARRPELNSWGAYKDTVGRATIFELHAQP